MSRLRLKWDDGQSDVQADCTLAVMEAAANYEAAPAIVAAQLAENMAHPSMVRAVIDTALAPAKVSADQIMDADGFVWLSGMARQIYAECLRIDEEDTAGKPIGATD